MLKTLNEAAVAVDELLATQVDGLSTPIASLESNFITDGDDSSTEAGSDIGRIDDVEEEFQEDVRLTKAKSDLTFRRARSHLSILTMIKMTFTPCGITRRMRLTRMPRRTSIVNSRRC